MYKLNVLIILTVFSNEKYFPHSKCLGTGFTTVDDLYQDLSNVYGVDMEITVFVKSIETCVRIRHAVHAWLLSTISNVNF